VVCEGDPFFALVVDFVGLRFILHFYFSFPMRDRGNLLLFAMARIVCHSVFFFLSGVSLLAFLI
jgi:hypothetical protein